MSKRAPRPASKRFLKALADSRSQAREEECRACAGYGYFDHDDTPSIDRRDRKCGDCHGEGKVRVNG